jgi:hypothetical protein
MGVPAVTDENLMPLLVSARRERDAYRDAGERDQKRVEELEAQLRVALDRAERAEQAAEILLQEKAVERPPESVFRYFRELHGLAEPTIDDYREGYHAAKELVRWNEARAVAAEARAERLEEALRQIAQLNGTNYTAEKARAALLPAEKEEG